MALEERLKQVFASVDAEAVLLWGSHAQGEATPRSDVDVCLVAGPSRHPADVLASAWRSMRPGDLQVDVKVFEDLPVYLQGEVLRAHTLLRCHDAAALYLYLRPAWKRWNDQRHRQVLTEDEARRLLSR